MVHQADPSVIWCVWGRTVSSVSIDISCGVPRIEGRAEGLFGPVNENTQIFTANSKLYTEFVLIPLFDQDGLQ
jgi:hypothetical protein